MASCNHDDFEIVSVIPALPGWGFAVLYNDGKWTELEIKTIALWALVRRNVDECTCSETVVLPMTPALGLLRPEVDEEDSEFYTLRILQPGERATAVRDGDGFRLRVERGTWQPGLQPIEGLAMEAA